MLLTATLLVAMPGGSTQEEEPEMYGLIGKMIAVPGERDALLEEERDAD